MHAFVWYIIQSTLVSRTCIVSRKILFYWVEILYLIDSEKTKRHTEEVNSKEVGKIHGTEPVAGKIKIRA